MPTLESLLSIAQVARLVGVSQRTLRRMIAEDRTPQPVRIGRAIRMRASEVDLWIKLGCPDRRTLEATHTETEGGGA